MPRYINQLQDEKLQLLFNSGAAQQQITDLIAYLLSSKFNCGSELDGYVNRDDIIPRLMEIRSTLQTD